jgi:hypothetical protein
MTKDDCQAKLEALMKEVVRTLKGYQLDDDWLSMTYDGRSNTIYYFNSGYIKDGVKPLTNVFKYDL